MFSVYAKKFIRDVAVTMSSGRLELHNLVTVITHHRYSYWRKTKEIKTSMFFMKADSTSIHSQKLLFLLFCFISLGSLTVL